MYNQLKYDRKSTHGSMSILIQFMDGSLCLLSDAFTEEEKTYTHSYMYAKLQDIKSITVWLYPCPIPCNLY
jgi:hypothetical protein